MVSNFDITNLHNKIRKLEASNDTLAETLITLSKQIKVIVRSKNLLAQRVAKLERRVEPLEEKPDCLGTLDEAKWVSGECAKCNHFDRCFQIAW